MDESFPNATKYDKMMWDQSFEDGTTPHSSYQVIESASNIAATLNNTLRMAVFLDNYYNPCVCVTGSVGNIVSIVVFFRTKLRKLSSSYYLAALGMSDTVFLLSNLLSWSSYGQDILTIDIFCKLLNFFVGASSLLSSWFVVAFTVERFIAVLYPLKRQTMCTVRRAKMMLACLLIVSLLDCTPLLFFFGTQDSNCFHLPEHEVRSIFYYCINITESKHCTVDFIHSF